MAKDPIKALIIERISQTMTEDKDINGIIDSIASGGIGTHAKEAKKWVEDAIKSVRSAPGGARYSSDEEVAAELLAAIDERKRKQYG